MGCEGIHMKKWAKKSLVVLVSILSFGMVTPSHAIWNENHEQADQQNYNRFYNNDQYAAIQTTEEDKLDHDKLVGKMMTAAEKQSYDKFGPKIKPLIEDEFRQLILPNIQKAIDQTINQYPEEKLASLQVTEDPSGGNGEKIFHIYDRENGEDVIRFHVRKDHPPLEGYYFNFHYHTKFDQYQTHNHLGSIYWDKNTPPKWMSV
jgi:hypothetical protein